MANQKLAFRIKVTGAVQGVGFRPFVYRTASRLNLSGFVRNQRDGVVIQVAGRKEELADFVSALEHQAPPASRIVRLEVRKITADSRTGFRIAESRSRKTGGLFVPADIAVCPDCLAEMSDRRDRRYRYPFINCTNCGPRYSIIRDLPYDRPNTVMDEFPLCAACRKEYLNPSDRRYHAEPIACAVCGPEAVLTARGKVLAVGDSALKEAADLLRQGKILAVKGIGGFHLVCDAANADSVRRLRRRKRRPVKPLALMAASEDVIRRYCPLTPEAAKILSGPARPIMLLEKNPPAKGPAPLPEIIAPDSNYLGFFLAYAPLHFLLFGRGLEVLVATSANLSGEPIICDDAEAEQKLSGIADFFLSHNRKILNRSDDSIVMPVPDGGRERFVFIRRSRGYAPLPAASRFSFPPSLAFGAEEKAAFALADGRSVFLSPYLGDLQNYENRRFMEKTLTIYRKLFPIKPAFLATDLHPDYAGRRLAEEAARREKAPLFSVQHHKAHIASVLAETGVREEVIGVAFDGTGYGEDGRIWGGEFFVGNRRSLERAGHLLPFALAGGDLAVKQPWRTALALLHEAGLPPPENFGAGKNHSASPAKRRALGRLLEQGYAFPRTTSAGRLFDGVSALLGLCLEQSYDAEAPVRLQTAAEKGINGRLKAYPFGLNTRQGMRVVDWRPIIAAISGDLAGNRPKETIAAVFHLTLAEIILSVCRELRQKGKISKGLSAAAPRAILAGGVFQNRLLLSLALKRLKAAGFEVLLPKDVPVNDSGVCLGQLLLAKGMLQREMP